MILLVKLVLNMATSDVAVMVCNPVVCGIIGNIFLHPLASVTSTLDGAIGDI